MELELRNYNVLECNLFKQAQITFPEENAMHVCLPDTVISREKSEILVEYFHKVFCERGGMDLKVEVEFVKPQESRYRQNAALQIAQEVENVMKQAGISRHREDEEALAPAKEPENQTEAAAKASKSPKADKPQEKKPFERKNEYRGFRRDSNPDVVYGRDFEGDPITLESITGEMGEVIIRGQVMEVDAREIRNEKTILIFPITDFYRYDRGEAVPAQ